MSHELWEGEVEILAATGEAILVEYEGAEAWIPRSLIKDDITEVEDKGDVGLLVIPLWKAEQIDFA